MRSPGPYAQVKLGVWILYLYHVELGGMGREEFAEYLSHAIVDAAVAAAFGNARLGVLLIGAALLMMMSSALGRRSAA